MWTHESPLAGPHVVYLIHNDAYADTRVLKYAATAAKAGLRATLLAISPDGGRHESYLGGAKIIRLPVSVSFRTPRRFRTWRKYIDQPLAIIGYHNATRGRYAALRARLAALDLNADRGLEMWRADHSGAPYPSGLGALTHKVWRRARFEVNRGRSRVIKVRRRLGQGWVFRKPPDGQPAGRLTRRHEASVRGVRWRRDLPFLRDLEIAFAPVLDQLGADLIHVHDVYLMGTAAHSAFRARARGRQVNLVYDAREWTPGLAVHSPRVIESLTQHEREFLPYFDAVLTVSAPIADEFVRVHRVPRQPKLVFNVPLTPRQNAVVPSIRDVCGLDDEPLAVYAGGLHRSRGVHVVVEALAHVPDLHMAVVARGASTYVNELEDLASRIGVDQRLHIAPFVAPDQVSGYISSATVALSPLMRGPLNHEWAMPNKLFEYLHARLPVVVSDCPAMAEFVCTYDVGEVYRFDDPLDCGRALRAVLKDPERYIATDDLLREFSWQRQAERILSCYHSVLRGQWQAPQHADLEPTDLTEHPVPLRSREER